MNELDIKLKIKSIEDKLKRLEQYVRTVFISIFVFLVFFSTLKFSEISAIEKRIKVRTELTDLFNHAGVEISWEN